MRQHNSVGGYRIYPSSRQASESLEAAVAVIGQFREGMDRLNRERQLTQVQQNLVNNLDPNRPLARGYQGLITASNRIWQLALNKQQALARYEDSGQFSTEELGQHLNECANCWQELKRLLDQQA